MEASLNVLLIGPFQVVVVSIDVGIKSQNIIHWDGVPQGLVLRPCAMSKINKHIWISVKGSCLKVFVTVLALCQTRTKAETCLVFYKGSLQGFAIQVEFYLRHAFHATQRLHIQFSTLRSPGATSLSSLRSRWFHVSLLPFLCIILLPQTMLKSPNPVTHGRALFHSPPSTGLER